MEVFAVITIIVLVMRWERNMEILRKNAGQLESVANWYN